MAGFGLGTARGYIELLYRDGAAAAAQRDLTATQKVAQKAGKGMLIAGAGIAAGFGYAINTAADFEKQISAIGAVTGASGKDLEAYRQKALQIGADTAFSASQGALAIEELAKAGLSLPDIMNGAADATVALAAAGEIELPEAATIASNAMNQFELAAQDLPHVADLLAGAANASAIGVTDLGESFKFVGPIANALGVSIDDAASAIAILGNQGIKGSEAGTALRSILSQLAPTTDPAREAFRELGLLTEDGTNKFIDATGALKPMNEIIQILHDSTKNLSDVERGTFYKTAFGTESLAAASVLGGQTAASFDKMSASIAKIKSADVAKARLDNFKGAIDSFKGSLETAAIIVGSIFLPIFTSITRAVTGLIGKFAALSPATQKIIAYVAAFLGILLLIGGAILTAVATIGALSGVLTAGAAAFGGIAAVVTGTILPIIAIVAAIGLLVAGIIYAYKHFEGFRKVIQSIIGVVKTVASAIVGGLVSAFNFLRDHIDDVVAFFQAFVEKLKAVGLAIYNSIKPHIDAVVAQFKELMATVIPIAQGIGKAFAVGFKLISGFITGILIPVLSTVGKFLFNYLLKPLALVAAFIASKILPILLKLAGFFIGVLLNSVLSGIRGVIQTVQGFFQFISGIVRLIAALLTGNWSAAWAAIKTIFAGAFNFLAGLIRVFLAVTVLKAFGVAWSALKALLAAGWGAIKGLFTGSLGTISGMLARWVFWIRSFISAAWKFVVNIFKGALKGIWNFIKAYFRLYQAIIRTGLNAIRAVMQAVWGFIVRLILGVFRSIRQAISAAMQVIRGLISAGWNFIKGIFSRAGSAIWNTMKSAWNRVRSTVQTAMGNLKRAVSEGISKVVQAVKELPGKAMQGLGNLSNMLFQAGKDFIMGFINGIKNMAGAAASAAGDVASGAVNKVKGFLHIGSPSKVMEEIGRWTSEGFANGIGKAAKLVGKAAVEVSAVVPSTATTVAPSATLYRPASGRDASSEGGSGGDRTVNVYPSRGMSEAEIARQAVIRLGGQFRGRSVPIPAPAGGY